VVRLHYLHRMLQKELQRIAQKTAVQANKKRSEGPDFQEGEMVYLLRKNIKTKRPSNKLDHTKLGPYKIKRKKGPVSFELDLPKTMRIHPTFHKSLLEACHNPEARPGQVTVDPEIQEPEYEVEEIKANKVRKGQPYYLIKWKGYDESENTWEPIENIPRNLVRQFHKEEGPPDSGHRDFFIVDEILSHRNTKKTTLNTESQPDACCSVPPGTKPPSPGNPDRMASQSTESVVGTPPQMKSGSERATSSDAGSLSKAPKACISRFNILLDTSSNFANES